MATVTGLWGDLPAVKSGQAYEVEDETWMVGIGVLGAGEILDDGNDEHDGRDGSGSDAGGSSEDAHSWEGDPQELLAGAGQGSSS